MAGPRTGLRLELVRLIDRIHAAHLRTMELKRTRLDETTARLRTAAAILPTADDLGATTTSGAIRSGPFSRVGPDGLFLDGDALKVIRDNRAVDFGRIEFGLLELLSRKPGTIVTIEKIGAIWDPPGAATLHKIRQVVHIVGVKLDGLGAPNLIHAADGGYLVSPRPTLDPGATARVLAFGDGQLTLNTHTGVAHRGDREIQLKPPQDVYLHRLMNEPGRTVSIAQLVTAHADTGRGAVSTDAVVTDVKRLQRSLVYGGEPQIVHRKGRGYGYILKLE